MSKKFTQQLIESLPLDGREHWDFDATLPGFAVRRTKSGKKLFIARARIGTRRKYFPLGDASVIRLTEARKEAARVLEALRDGRDPEAERQARQKAMAAGETTIETLAGRWMSEVVKPKRKPRTAEDYARLFEQRINPALGHLTVARISREDAIRWHSGMKAIPRRANYALATLKALLNFAEDIGLRAPHTNPAARIEMFREGKRERFLSSAEIAKAADAITAAERAGKIGPHAAAGLRLALFTGARSGEITAAKWVHFNREHRVIRLPDSKTNEPRTVHLSDATLDVLAGLKRVGPYIIAGAKKDEPLKNLSRAWIVARKYGDLDDVRLHDLRHSFASLAANRGVSLKMIGELLGHKVAATTQRYAHIAREAAAAVNDELGAAMTAAIQKRSPPGAKIVKLQRKRASRS